MQGVGFWGIIALVPRHGLVYTVHAVTGSGLGSFDQVLETFAFVK